MGTWFSNKKKIQRSVWIQIQHRIKSVIKLKIIIIPKKIYVLVQFFNQKNSNNTVIFEIKKNQPTINLSKSKMSFNNIVHIYQNNHNSRFQSKLDYTTQNFTRILFSVFIMCFSSSVIVNICDKALKCAKSTRLIVYWILKIKVNKDIQNQYNVIYFQKFKSFCALYGVQEILLLLNRWFHMNLQWLPQIGYDNPQIGSVTT